VRRDALHLLVGKKSEDVFGNVAPVASGAAIGGDASRVGPATHGVGADAELARHVGDAQPGGVGSLSQACHEHSSPIGTVSGLHYQNSQIPAALREVREETMAIVEGDVAPRRPAT